MRPIGTKGRDKIPNLGANLAKLEKSRPKRGGGRSTRRASCEYAYGHPSEIFKTLQNAFPKGSYDVKSKHFPGAAPLDPPPPPPPGVVYSDPPDTPVAWARALRGLADSTSCRYAATLVLNPL